MLQPFRDLVPVKGNTFPINRPRIPKEKGYNLGTSSTISTLFSPYYRISLTVTYLNIGVATADNPPA